MCRSNRSSRVPCGSRSGVVCIASSKSGSDAIRRAREGDFSEVQRLLKALQAPFDERAGEDDLAALPPDWAAGIEISCSS